MKEERKQRKTAYVYEHYQSSNNRISLKKIIKFEPSKLSRTKSGKNRTSLRFRASGNIAITITFGKLPGKGSMYLMIRIKPIQSCVNMTMASKYTIHTRLPLLVLQENT